MAKNTPIGKVVHWYDKIGVAVIKLAGGLKVGDSVRVAHGDKEFTETIASIELDHAPVKSGKSGEEIAVKLSEKAGESSLVYLAE